MSNTNNLDYLKLKKEFEEFTYIVSHDLRAPLRAISSITDWIQEDLSNENTQEVKDNFSVLKQKVSRLDRMIASLIELSRVDSRNNDTSDFFVDQLVNDVVEDVLIDHKNLVITKHIPKLQINSFKTKLYQVISEVLKNSSDHNSEDTEVTVIIKAEKDHLLIVIEDFGQGSSESLENMFRIFYTTSKKDKNIGLGLPLTKKITENVGGSIKIAKKEKGLLTTIIWPVF